MRGAEVSGLIATPTPFAPEWGETTTVTAVASAGAVGLKPRVWSADLGSIWRGNGLALTETTPGICTVVWDGKSDSGLVVPPGRYYLRVYSTQTAQDVGPYESVDTTDTAAPPTVTAVSPASGANDAPLGVTITGAGFRTGATTRLTRAGEEDISGTSVSVNGAPQIGCVFDINGAEPGNWNVVVTASTSALVADVSRAQHYGTSLGVLSTIMDVGHPSGPVVAGLLTPLLAYTGTYRVLALLMILALVGFLAMTTARQTEGRSDDGPDPGMP